MPFGVAGCEETRAVKCSRRWRNERSPTRALCTYLLTYLKAFSFLRGDPLGPLEDQAFAHEGGNACA